MREAFGVDTLCPVPRRVIRLGDNCSVTTETPVVVRTVVDLPAQGYRLTVNGEGAFIEAADAAGEHYARLTLVQLGASTPGVRIEDWPDLAIRAVMLDVSRDRVPTMAALRDLIDTLAGWKVNQLQLYFEHTFAYADHRDVWKLASPFTPDEVRELDTYCSERYIELVPNQNCLGHAERWLRHPTYRDLALSPDGFDMMGLRRGPTTLDPSNPAAFAHIASLLDELVPCFATTRVHVGMDEPWELPPDRIDEYVQWIQRLCDLPVLSDRQVLVWGDIMAHHPTVLKALPDNVVVTEWGYEADHPFTQRAAPLAESGRAWWACPGTSSWQSLLGRTTNMRANTAAASLSAAKHGATGLLMTDWGDWGHHQPSMVSMPGYAYGAAMSWCANSNTNIDLATMTDPAAVALGDVYLSTAAQRPNCSLLVRHLYFPQARVRHIMPDELDAAREQLARGSAVLGNRTDSDANELRWASEVVDLAIDDAAARIRGDGSLASISAESRLEFAERALHLETNHADLWPLRSRPGGLADSRKWFTRLREAYIAGVVPEGWPYPEVDVASS